MFPWLALTSPRSCLPSLPTGDWKFDFPPQPIVAETSGESRGGGTRRSTWNSVTAVPNCLRRRSASAVAGRRGATKWLHRGTAVGRARSSTSSNTSPLVAMACPEQIGAAALPVGKGSARLLQDRQHGRQIPNGHHRIDHHFGLSRGHQQVAIIAPIHGDSSFSLERLPSGEKIDSHADRPQRPIPQPVDADLDQILLRANQGFGLGLPSGRRQGMQIARAVGVMIGKFVELDHVISANFERMPEAGRVAQPAKRQHPPPAKRFQRLLPCRRLACPWCRCPALRDRRMPLRRHQCQRRMHDLDPHGLAATTSPRDRE